MQRYGFFGFDGKEIKDAEVTCDVCGCGCYEESYLYDDEMDICPRCFKLDAKSSQQYEDCLLYTSPSPRDLSTSRMPSSA